MLLRSPQRDRADAGIFRDHGALRSIPGDAPPVSWRKIPIMLKALNEHLSAASINLMRPGIGMLSEVSDQFRGIRDGAELLKEAKRFH